MIIDRIDVSLEVLQTFSGIGDRSTAAANKEVERITSAASSSGQKRKRHATYTDKNRAKISRYAAEIGNVAALNATHRSMRIWLRAPNVL